MTREPSTTPSDEALRARLKEAQPSRGDELDGLFAEIESGVKRADAHPLASVRATPTRTRRAIAVGAFIAIFVFTLVTNARADMSLYPMPRLVAECAAYITLLCLSIFAAVRSEAMPMLSRRTIALLVSLGLLATLVLAMVPAPHALPIHLVGRGPITAWSSGAPCMYFGLALGIPVYAVMRLVDRGSPLGSVLAASAAGLLANLVLQVHCSVTSVGHRLAGHATIGPVLLVCLGAALLFERLVMSPKRP